MDDDARQKWDDDDPPYCGRGRPPRHPDFNMTAQIRVRIHVHMMECLKKLAVARKKTMSELVYGLVSELLDNAPEDIGW